jgi:hypothetical protein
MVLSKKEAAQALGQPLVFSKKSFCLGNLIAKLNMRP